MSEPSTENAQPSMTALRLACYRKRKERDRLQKRLDKARRLKENSSAIAIRIVALIVLGPRLSKNLRNWTTVWRDGEAPVPVEQTADVFEAFIHRLVGRRSTIGVVAMIAAIPALFTFWILLKQNGLMETQVAVAEAEAFEKRRVDLLTRIFDLAPPGVDYGQVRGAALRTYLEMERRAQDPKVESQRINLVEAPLGDLLIQKLDLSRIDFRYATMPNSNGMCDLVESDCRGAIFNGARIGNCKVHRSAFIESIWKGISSIGVADVSESLFQDAKMSGVFLSDALFSDCDFSGAILSNSEIRGVRFTDCSFAGANLRGATINVSWVAGSDRGNLPHSPDFCEFVRVDFSKADLRGVTFVAGTIFENVTFSDTLIDEKTVLPVGISSDSAGLIFKASEEVENEEKGARNE